MRWIHEIAQVVAGSAEEFRRCPALVGYAEIRSPLCFDRNMVEIFLEYVKLGVPQTVDTMPAGGSTAPVTAAGILALGAAETLAAVVLAYAVRDDAVVAMDITPSYADMHTGLFKYSRRRPLQSADGPRPAPQRILWLPDGRTRRQDRQLLLQRADRGGEDVLHVAAGPGRRGGHRHGRAPGKRGDFLAAATGDRQRAGPLRAPRHPHAVGRRPRDAGHRVDPRGRPGRQLPERTHTAEHFRDELFFSPLFPVRPWAEAQQKPDEFDQTRKAHRLATELWRKPEEPVLRDDQIRAIELIVKRATQ